MKRMAILVGGFYPYYGNPMGVVLGKLCPVLKNFCDTTVIALQNVGSPDVKDVIFHEDIEIHTATSWLHRTLNLKGDRQSVSYYIAKLYVRIRMLFGWRAEGDYKISIVGDVLAQVYKDRKVDVVLSLGFPQQMHDAARKFKKLHPEVRWITYSTDTNYASINATRIRVRFVRDFILRQRIKNELSCFRNADYNFFSREIYENCLGFLEPILDKCSILDYTLTNSVNKASGELRLFDKNKINMLFAGGVGRPMRDPSYFAKVFASCANKTNCVLHLYMLRGSQPFFDEPADGLADHIVLHDPVSPEVMRQLMEEADILVNLGNDSDVFSPSKLFDYVSTGLPIVCTTYRGRKVNEILNRIPNVLLLENYSDVESDSRRLMEFCKNVKGVRTPFSQIEALLPEYMLNSVVGKLVAKLD